MAHSSSSSESDRVAGAPASGDARAHHDLGMTLAQAGRAEEAIAQLQAACRLAPDTLEFVNNLGAVCEEHGLLADAIAHYRKAVALAPLRAVPQFNLGDALRKAGEFAEAIQCLEQATSLDPNLPEPWEALGQLFLNQNRPDDAALAWHGHGRALLEAGRNVEAIASLQKSRMLHPMLPGPIHDHGKALFNLGCLEHAMLLIRRAAEIDSGTGAAAVQPLAIKHQAVFVPGSPVDDNTSILKLRQRYARMLAGPEPRPPAVRPRIRRNGPWRIGYVSSFYSAPQWMKPVWGLLNHHDRSSFEVHLFSACEPGKIDPAYRRHPHDRVHVIGGMSNDEAAATIAAQEIDLLVDLNGYSDPDRLPLYALRPAAKQATWFNMYATSGMDCFDALIGDATVVPAGEECFYTESIERLPGTYLAFACDGDQSQPTAPAIAPEPPGANGPFTFGCLASSYKLTNVTLAAWAEILSRSPGARMLFRNAGLGREDHRSHLRDRLVRLGVAPERLAFEGPAGHQDFIDTYRRIDVALDPFPYSGGTTTSEALWQGVPVVTFTGNRWASRTSASLLQSAGLGEYVAADRRGYVDLAVRLATSRDTPAMLRAFRGTIRSRLRASATCDAASLARGMEAIYRRLLDPPNSHIQHPTTPS
jgi:protein O-GlcNAc transferase